MNKLLIALCLITLAILVAGAGNAQAQAGASEVEKFQAELAKRDAVIERLERRLDALEAREGLRAKRATAAASNAGVVAPTPRQVETQAQATPPSQAANSSTPADADASGDDGLDRTLERSLTLSGGLLLPKWQIELEPGVQYGYIGRSGLAVVNSGGSSAIAQQEIRADIATSTLQFRMGLPGASQFELLVPYGYDRIEVVTAGTSTVTDASGFRDIELGLSKQFTSDRGWMPGLLGNVTWQPSTGSKALSNWVDPMQGSAGAPPGQSAGFDSVSVSMTAVKRKDPVVFLASLNHTFVSSESRSGVSIEPSDINGGSVQAILAASPDVSLRGAMFLSYIGDTRMNGVRVPGSNQTVGVFELGGSIVLSDRVLLDLTAGMGLTPDSPDFVVGIALPIKF